MSEGAIVLRPSQVEMLREIEAENVGYQWTTGRGASYRLWVTHSEYVLVTAKVRRLIELGLAKEWEGVGLYGRGSVEITPAGRDALRAADGSSSEVSQ